MHYGTMSLENSLTFSGPTPKRWTLLFLIVGCCVVFFIIGLVIGLVARGGGEVRDEKGGAERLRRMEEYDSIRKRLNEYIKPQNILDTLRFMSSEPHIAGSARQEELADWVKQKWEEFGADHVVKTPYKVLLSYPDRNNPNKVSILDSSGTPIFETSGFEKILSADQNHSDVIPPFNAYSPAGSVQGELVYANYGRASDFDELQKLGVNCSGKIVIARYGLIYRGNKLYEAQLRGALGLILYTDPGDGAPTGAMNVFPNTWWLPGTGIERGSTMLVKGDQLTQGYPAKDYAYRTPLDDWKANIQLQIPCQPIGYDEAREFLSRLAGSQVPNGWEGGLNFTYHLGPGFRSSDSGSTVRLQVHNTEMLKTIYNVVGRMEGTEEPDRYVIIGGHRDAWMYGSVDAVSSQASMIEVVRVFGQLKKEGWRPKRTLMFISWDAEEYGMVGSYEWVEEHWKTLQDRAVAYLNGDTALSGNYTLWAWASPVLKDILIETTKEVPNPGDPTKSVYDTWRIRSPEDPGVEDDNPSVPVPGSGTDHAHFLFFAGIPITYHQFNAHPSLNTLGYPLYHTVYETFQLVRLIDPEAKVLTAFARVWAKLAHSLLDRKLLPLNVSRTADIIAQYTETVKERHVAALQQQGINFEPLQSAARNLSEAAARFEVFLHRVDSNNPLAVRQANDKAMKLERMFIDPAGQPGRPMLKHVVFSPSSKDSYKGSVFSGLGDLLYDMDKVTDPAAQWVMVKKQFAVMIHTVQSAADFLIQP